MKGLLKKDFMLIFKGTKRILLISAVLLICFGTMGGINSISPLLVVYSSILTFNIFYFDHASHWNTMCACLPVRAEQVVLSRYLFSLITAFCGVILSAGLSVLAYAFMQERPPFSEYAFENAAVIAALFLVAIVFQGVLLPLIYKFGVEKARMFFVLIAMVPIAAMLLFRNVIPSFAIQAVPTQAYVVLGVICAILIPVGSYFISLRFYKATEF